MPQRPRRLAFLLLAWHIVSASGVVILGLAACAAGPVSYLQID